MIGSPSSSCKSHELALRLHCCTGARLPFPNVSQVRAQLTKLRAQQAKLVSKVGVARFHPTIISAVVASLVISSLRTQRRSVLSNLAQSSRLL